MFSATGNILPGARGHGSVVTLLDPTNRYAPDTQTCTWNKLGYTPLVSTITGCARALLGTIHTIVHLTLALFDAVNRNYHLQEVRFGGCHIVRGVAEMVPILGNLYSLGTDLLLASQIDKQVGEYRTQHHQDCENHVLVFYDGELAGRKSFDEMNVLAHQAGYILKPSFWQIVDLVVK